MTIQNEYLLSQKFNNINHNSYWKWLWLKFYAHSCDMIGSTKVGDIILDTKYIKTLSDYRSEHDTCLLSKCEKIIFAKISRKPKHGFVLLI